MKQILRNPVRLCIEQAVSEFSGRLWTVRQVRNLADFACHPAAILSDGTYAVFAKFSEAANGGEQFEIELAGLQYLAERAGVLVPIPIEIFPVSGGWVLLLEAVQEVMRTAHDWRQIGLTLARLHRIQGQRFGFHRQGYFGPLPQDNKPMEDWPTFYAERRLIPGLKMAVDSGNLPRDIMHQVEKLIRRLPELCGPEVPPALLHGDAQQNNFISTEQGAVVIDPAVYFGHPEMDLAYIDYFQPVPGAVFEGYQEALPIEPGFWERRDLWRIWGYLAAVAVEGGGHLERLTGALHRYG
ncbi:MAG: fructosamine kinase family protein [Anaerolineales bacterium]|jgi:fructosamine-3-kinase|nr:fructosamine kinase family protein [Anaerolineales bacterium]